MNDAFNNVLKIVLWNLRAVSDRYTACAVDEDHGNNWNEKFRLNGYTFLFSISENSVVVRMKDLAGIVLKLGKGISR